MIQARHTRWGIWFWNTFSQIGAKLFFQRFEYKQKVSLDADKSLLLIGNHIGMWDPFWVLKLNQDLWGRRFYGMMLESELRTRMLLTRGGAFSIQKRSRSIIESLNYAVAQLQEPQNLVLLYPQGRIHSLYDRPIRFEPGLGKIISKAGEKTQLVFYVALVDYLAHFRPSVSIYLHKCSLPVGTPLKEIELAYNTFYENCLVRQSELAAQDDIG